MTPCEKLGYKVGDRFIVNGSGSFSDGSEVELLRDDCTDSPLFKLLSGYSRFARAGGEKGAYAELKYVTPHAPVDTLTGALEYACDELAAAQQHEAKAAEHRANHDGAMEHVRDMLPDGWMLVRGGVDWAKGEDMTDPANWREGDVIEALVNGLAYTKGRQYKITGFDGDGDPRFRDDDGDSMSRHAHNFRFHSRPTT